jgi:hypothetical protein
MSVLFFITGRTTDDSFGKDIYTYRRRFSDNIFSVSLGFQNTLRIYSFTVL